MNTNAKGKTREEEKTQKTIFPSDTVVDALES